VVVHSISLPPGEYGGDAGAGALHQHSSTGRAPLFPIQIEGLQVSAHFYVRRGGELWQFVSCDERAWHAGVSHWRGRDNCNDDSIGIELEGLEGEPFERRSTRRWPAVCAALAQRYPVRHVAGHEHIAPGRKQDPGAASTGQLLRRATRLECADVPRAATAALIFLIAERPAMRCSCAATIPKIQSAGSATMRPAGPNPLASHGPCGLRDHRPVFMGHRWRCAVRKQIRTVIESAEKHYI
jgi:AmpD protein